MDRAHLSLERERLRDRLRHDRAPDPWLVERLDRIEEALRRAR
jgi:hypothetical protein